MSVSAAPARPSVEPPSPLSAYRDDGPLAQALGRSIGTAVRLPAALLTLLAGVPLLAVVAAGGGRAALAAPVAWLVLVAGLAAGRPASGRLGWLPPPLLRLLEYGALLRFAVLAGGRAVPVCFALIATLAFHHYDTVYRLRNQRLAPPAWVERLGGGWEGRVLVAYLLLLAGALTAGLAIAAGVLAVAYVAESTVSWVRFGHRQRLVVSVGEEDE